MSETLSSTLRPGQYVWVEGKLTETQPAEFPAKLRVYIHGVGTGIAKTVKPVEEAAPDAPTEALSLPDLDKAKATGCADAAMKYFENRETVQPAPGAGEGLREVFFKNVRKEWPCPFTAKKKPTCLKENADGPMCQYCLTVKSVMREFDAALRSASPVAPYGPDIVLREVERGKSFKGKHGKLGCSAQPKDREG